MRVLVAAVVCFAFLAGCQGDASTDDEDLLVPQEVKVDNRRLGAISGVIIDEAIRPIAGASIERTDVDGATKSTQSDKTGRFVMEDLEPGLYFLTVRAESHLNAQQAVEVLAGKVSKPKIVLNRDATTQPYQETVALNGILRASTWYATYAYTRMAGNWELCECEFIVEMAPSVEGIIVEAFWEPRVAIPGHELFFEVASAELGRGDALYSTTPFHKIYLKEFFEGHADQALIRVGSRAADVDQEFEVFVTMFHLSEPPEDWSIAHAAG